MVDAQRNRVLSPIEIGSPIRDIALSPDGATAYVGSCGPDFGTVLDVVDVRDARECAIIATYKIGDVAGVLSGLTLSRDGSRAYLVGDTERHGAVHRRRRTSSAASRPVASRHVRSRARPETGCTSPTTPARSPSWPSTRQPPRPCADIGRRTDRCARVGLRRPAGARTDPGLAPSPSRRLVARGMIATRVGVWRAGPG